MLLLFISIAMLASAPLIYFGAAHVPKLWRFLDLIVTVLVTALVVLHLLPESIRNVGSGAIPLAFLGLFLPSLLERMWAHGAGKIHSFSIAIALGGLMIHGMLDGAALALPAMPMAGASLNNTLLRLAVILHRLPAALFIWSLFYPKIGGRGASIILVILGLGTALGYASGEWILARIHNEGAVVFYLQALVAGSLLHIAFDRHDESHHSHEGEQQHSHEALSSPPGP